MNAPDHATHYGGTAHGYTDDPALSALPRRASVGQARRTFQNTGKPGSTPVRSLR